jgi:tripartite-type tricarboxylate transporter receptor subunit TctC
LSRGQITFFINKTTPTDQIKQMQFDIAQALQTPEIKESIELVHGKLWTENADEFNRFIVKTINDNRQIIKQQGIQDKQ